MTCYCPLKGYRSREPEKSGKHRVVFTASSGLVDKPVTLPCGRCVGCRLEKSRQWAIRCSHEASLYEANSFITLTYDDGRLPPLGSLNLPDFQKFMKRLRKSFPTNKIRFYHCGEYGEDFARPHYHALLFNFEFEDKIHFKTRNNQKIYISETLTKLWPLGLHEIGEVTFESAAYCARYVMKKINGDQSEKHYRVMDPETGEILGTRTPEYSTMSRRPGIGSEWFKKFKNDVYPSDFITLKGRKMKPPKYYDVQHEIHYPSDQFERRLERVAKSAKQKWNNTPERLRVRETVQKARLKNLKRNLENDA